jgi:glyoxylase-like metal-dependent hydrolase (beta-lactamase superfamily II)
MQLSNAGDTNMQIHTLDLHFQGVPHTIASYLLVGPAGPVLVETGPGSTLKNLLARLADYGYGPTDIDHVLVTHIHLDHAGAAGWWAQQGAQVYVHHVGAKHLIDPTKLLASAQRIYGDQLDSLWGETLPAPETQVKGLYDGDQVEVGGLSITALDTPGHASHHHVYQLEDIAFTGDAAGIQIPGPYFVDLPAPPPEFNLELWQHTIERLLSLPLTAIYPTHFGRIEAWRQQLQDLAVVMETAAGFVKTCMETGLERAEILTRYLERYQTQAKEMGMAEEVFEQYELANPHYMSVDGLMRYWRKKDS